MPLESKVVLKFVDSRLWDAFRNIVKTQNNAHSKAKSMCASKASSLPAVDKVLYPLSLQLLFPKFGRRKIEGSSWGTFTIS